MNCVSQNSIQLWRVYTLWNTDYTYAEVSFVQKSPKTSAACHLLRSQMQSFSYSPGIQSTDTVCRQTPLTTPSPLSFMIGKGGNIVTYKEPKVVHSKEWSKNTEIFILFPINFSASYTSPNLVILFVGLMEENKDLFFWLLAR